MDSIRARVQRRDRRSERLWRAWRTAHFTTLALLTMALLGAAFMYWHNVIEYQVFPKRFSAVEEGSLYRSGQISAGLLRDVFTEDAGAAYDKGKYSATGRDAVMEFLVGALKREDVASMHNVHCPELELTSPTTAKGTWYLHDYVINPGEDNGGMPGHSILQGAGFYSDEYEKVDGEWKIMNVIWQSYPPKPAAEE